MAARFATRTRVNSSDSRAEIERTLLRYGADGFAYAWEQGKGAEIAVIGFKMRGRMIRFRLTMPPRSDFKYTPERRGQLSNGDAQRIRPSLEIIGPQDGAIILVRADRLETEIETVAQFWLCKACAHP